jgi:SOS response regulatory protein OraA/RecX
MTLLRLIASGMALFVRFCVLVCSAFASMLWIMAKHSRQRWRSVRRFEVELERKGIPKELREQVVERYKRMPNWLEVANSWKRRR